MANYPKSGKYQDVNLRMTEKSEQVLIQNRISSTGRIKERRIEITIR
jgi:hypothetical protein